MLEDYEPDVTLLPVVQRSGKYRSDVDGTTRIQSLVVLEITAKISSSNGHWLEVSVTGHDQHEQSFCSLVHCAELFHFDGIEDEDGLAVYRPCLPGGTIDVARTVYQEPLRARLEFSVDEIALVYGHEMAEDRDRSQVEEGVVKLAFALFFETGERPADLLLSYEVSTRGLLDSATPSSLKLRFMPEEWIPSTQQAKEFHGPFAWAARSSWLEVLRLWGSNAPAELGRTPFAWAVANGDRKVMEWYLETGDSASRSPILDARDKNGDTPLHLAVKYDRIEVVHILLESGADVRKRDSEARTPLMAALERGNCSITIPIFCHNNTVLNGSNFWECLRIADGNGASVIFQAASRSEQAASVLLTRIDRWYRMLGTQAYRDSETWTWVKYFLFQSIIWEQMEPFKKMLRNARKFGPYHLTIDTVWENQLQFGDSRTPLCIAAEKGYFKMVEDLLHMRADANYATIRQKNTPLMLAILGDAEVHDKEAVIEAILTFGHGVDISKQNMGRQTALSLAIDRNLPTICRLISRYDKDGPLAEVASEPVDDDYIATTTTFFVEEDGIRTEVSQKAVREVLKKPTGEANGKGKRAAFRWFHLPANNMTWVEVLMRRLYGTTAAYRILKPERWVGRQHKSMVSSDLKGEPSGDLHHARFMRPLCQSFGVLSKNTQRDTPEYEHALDANYVVFMPFLHWDLKCQQTRRMDIMGKHDSTFARGDPVPSDWDPEQKLLDTYLFPSDTRSHQLHVRRTLDQYYYYTLKHTEQRDGDQVLSRAACQKALNSEHKVLVMVDQLWLWVLSGGRDQPDTLISCFPVRQGQPDGDSHRGVASIPDPDRNNNNTDVLGHIRLYLHDNPSSVQSIHDLAKLITSTCSTMFFDLGSTEERLRFPEVYEMAIGDVVREETKLFDDFTAVMQTPDNEAQLKLDVIDLLRRVAKHGEKPSITSVLSADGISAGDAAENERRELKQMAIELCKAFYLTATRQPVSKSDMEVLWDSKGEREERIDVFSALRWIGQIQVLDIMAETKLLREIKDVRDELRIISMVYEDQKVVVDAMDIICAMNVAAEEKRRNNEQQEPPSHETVDGRGNEMEDDTEVTTLAAQTEEKYPAAERKNKQRWSDAVGSKPSKHQPVKVENTVIRVEGHSNNVFLSSSTQQTMASISESSSLSPQATVQRSIEAVQRMANRAHEAYKALTLLVDLKQKQSNVLDARSLRVQTEESLKMTKENERQGKTLMVFTLVTIIFLPMSFMAAFFAIPIAEFRRTGTASTNTDGQANGNDGTLDGTKNTGSGAGDPMMTLGYVSEILFPVSAAITAFLIYAAFKVEVMERAFDWMVERIGEAIKPGLVGIKRAMGAFGWLKAKLTRNRDRAEDPEARVGGHEPGSPK